MYHKGKYWMIAGLISGIVLTLFAAYASKSLLLLIIGLFWMGNTVYLLKRQQIFSKRQLEELSYRLHDVLERKPVLFSKTTDDTLDDKLASQIDKLQSLLQYYDQMLAFLIESFIIISRLEHYCIQIKKEKQDIRQTILQAMVALKEKADAQQVELKLLTAEPLNVLHDKNWLCEAIQNLLDNSIKYSYAGSTVEISFQDNEMFTSIQVRDYGIGIEEEEETKVFTRFYRGKRVTTQEGFGIGLYLAREIVLLHDGFMKVTRKETGLLAEIYLPR